MNWLQSLGAVDTIREYRMSVETMREQVLQNALAQLQKGHSPEEAMQELARQLTNKLMHAPCSNMKQAGYDGRAELLLAARELFNLKHSDN
jgi:glutamyl-tRNA reductase